MYVTCEVWPNQSHQPTEDQMEDVDPQPKKRSEKILRQAKLHLLLINSYFLTIVIHFLKTSEINLQKKH